MTAREIDGIGPDPLPARGETPLDQAREAMRRSGCWTKHQQMGHRWPIGCVALEITQRCNLDCTLCYLSEHSEAVKDVPIEEVFRRIELIRAHYGVDIDVQITGGEPTLRRRDELLAIVRRTRQSGLRPTLMTNGGRVNRALLEDLARAGLVDVAFHVDTTQLLDGYRSEADLNTVRASYLDRVQGLPLSVMFNTTVHDGNFDEIPDLVRFFRNNAGRIRTASFQVQAATGRGVLEKKRAITLDAVAAQIESGAGTRINFRGSMAGHPHCNRYGLCLAVNGRLWDALDDGKFIGRIQPATSHLVLDRMNSRKSIVRFLAWLGSHPRFWGDIVRWTVTKVWQMRHDLFASWGRVDTLSFFIHGFMDADALERDRIDGCVFKTMTGDGPISMCLHNAKRDHFILKPIRIHTSVGARFWQPLSGKLDLEHALAGPPDPRQYGLKRVKGRTRRSLLNWRSD